MRLPRLAIALLAACGGDDASSTTDAATDIDSSAEQPGPAYTLLAMPQLGASSAIRQPVRVLGTKDDRTPALDEVVLSFDRAGAGVFAHPVVTLGPLGATTTFTACNYTTPGCLGPLRLTAALAADPSTVVGSVDVELVDPDLVNPARRCLTGGNLLYLKGNDQIFNGEMTYANATWSIDSSFPEYLVVSVTPSGGGGTWKLAFDARVYAPALYPDAYENAQKSVPTVGALVIDQPAMDISGFGNACSFVTGRFDVVEYQTNGTITIAFEQQCLGSMAALSGCMHYAP